MLSCVFIYALCCTVVYLYSWGNVELYICGVVYVGSCICVDLYMCGVMKL